MHARLHALLAARSIKFKFTILIEVLHGLVHNPFYGVHFFDGLARIATRHPVFSSIFAYAYACVVQGSSQLLYLATSLIRICKGAVRHPKSYNHGWNLSKLAEDQAQELVPRFDGEVLRRTLYMLRSDDDLEQFFEAIPGFCASKIVDNPRFSLDALGLPRLAETLIGFWNRTLSSNQVTEPIKVRRLVVCVRVRWTKPQWMGAYLTGVQI